MGRVCVYMYISKSEKEGYSIKSYLEALEANIFAYMGT
jgi:hypothetical protein